MDKLKIAIITISDRSFKGERDDLTGPSIIKYLQEKFDFTYEYKIVPDEFNLIKSTLNFFVENEFDLILTNGGTGIALRDVTPEATKSVIEKEIPGITEYMRIKSSEIASTAILSKAVAGIKDKSLIINLPGSPKAAVENLNFIINVIPHAIHLIKGEVKDCKDDLDKSKN